MTLASVKLEKLTRKVLSGVSNFFILLDNDFYLLGGWLVGYLVGWLVYSAIVALVTVVLRLALAL